MIITPDNPKQIADRMRTTFKNELPESNPFLENSYLNADIVAYSGQLFQLYQQLNVTINELFPDTASVESLERSGAIYGVTRKPAAQSLGTVTVNGTDGSNIPNGTLMTNQAGFDYTTQSSVSISTVNISITSFSFNPSTVTMTTTNPHPLASNIEVTVSGFNEVEANGIFPVQVLDEVTFSYEAPELVSPPTGSPTVTSDLAEIILKSSDFGDGTNSISGTPINFGVTIGGVNQLSYVQFDGLTGGADIESSDSLRERLLFVIRNPYPFFSKSFLIRTVQEFPGVTRVFVQEGVGTVAIYFTLDNNENNLPSGALVDEVRDKIVNDVRFIGVRPENVIVGAPTPSIVNLSFSFISPDNDSMRQAIFDNIKDFFRTRTDIGKNIKNRELQCAIEQTIDFQTGDKLLDFNLTSPGGDIVLNNNEIAELGSISYDV